MSKKQFRLEVSIPKQIMQVFKDDSCINEYIISTGVKGAGEMFGSEQTPRGLHMVRAKIGGECQPNTVFISRRPTGEIYTPSLREKFPTRDWILTRIFWLSGLELGKNRLGDVDTMRRYIYIHGSPDDIELGKPGSRGCLRMKNQDIMELYNLIPVGTIINIEE